MRAPLIALFAMLAWLLTGAAAASAPSGTPPAPDADGIDLPLDGAVGDAARGRAIVADRQLGLCLLCHAAPIPEQRFQGNLGPSLAGSGARRSAAQLRLRLVDSGRLNPASIMPAYYRTDGLARVPAPLRGKPIFTAQQLEDVLAYLLTLKEQE